MYLKHFFIYDCLCLFIFSFYFIKSTLAKCSIQSPCSCKEDGFILNLNKLFSSGVSHKPLFSNVHLGSSKYSYSYNPCAMFNESTGCINVTLCQKTKDDTYAVGSLKSAQFFGSLKENNLEIHYNSTDNLKRNRKSVVHIICSGIDKHFAILSEDKPKDTYTFELKTNIACFPSNQLSLGSILCILFLVSVIIYLIGGVAYLRFVRGATGKEQIPNYEFWGDFPQLVKDGFIFSKNGCKGSTSDQTYEQI